MSNITLKSISKKQNEIVYRFNIPDEIKSILMRHGLMKEKENYL